MTRVEVTGDSPFGLDNLPYGVFSTPGCAPRVGVRVGDWVVDLAEALGDEEFARPSLNPFLARGRRHWSDVRDRVRELVAGDPPDAAVHPVRRVRMHLPTDIGDYVDFYACEHHASNVGRLFRPDAAALPVNWKHLPVGYHGRAGTVVVSGTEITRPSGQYQPTDAEPKRPVPIFGPCQRLDVEAELGFVVGTGSALGTPVPVEDFAEHVFGAVLVNDWSARDIQAWEYVPLGPFLGKSFATSISAWVVPLAALDGARVDGPVQDPTPLPYLRAAEPRGLDVDLRVAWNGQPVSYPPYREMYWSPAQMLAHLTVNGARVRTGDLFASGTVSGPRPHQRGSLLELTWGGREPLRVNGEPRTFLLDGDEIAISASAPGPRGGRIGFGEVRGRIGPALTRAGAR